MKQRTYVLYFQCKLFNKIIKCCKHSLLKLQLFTCNCKLVVFNVSWMLILGLSMPPLMFIYMELGKRD